MKELNKSFDILDSFRPIPNPITMLIMMMKLLHVSASYKASSRSNLSSTVLVRLDFKSSQKSAWHIKNINLFLRTWIAKYKQRISNALAQLEKLRKVKRTLEALVMLQPPPMALGRRDQVLAM